LLFEPAPAFAEASEGKQCRLVGAHLVRSEGTREKGKLRLFKVAA